LHAELEYEGPVLAHMIPKKEQVRAGEREGGGNSAGVLKSVCHTTLTLPPFLPPYLPPSPS